MPKVCQLFSGSSGNAIWIAAGNTKVLVDAGVSAKRIETALNQIGENAAELSAVFVTHEHGDHVSGLRVLASRYGIPVFTHEKVMAVLDEKGILSDKFSCERAEAHMELGGMEIIPFENSHDSVACLGYRFNLCGDRSVAVCTDTGYVTADARETLRGTDLVFLESNHEVTMLQNGYYPYPLKQRVLSDVGHLSNEASSRFAAELLEQGTTRIVLAHLSRDNNTPDIARQTALSALCDAGFTENRDFRLRVSAPENSAGAIAL